MTGANTPYSRHSDNGTPFPAADGRRQSRSAKESGCRNGRIAMLKKALVAILLLAAGGLQAQEMRLQPGDLLFYVDTGGMGAAVSASTGQYTHVAMVAEVGDTVWILDATQRHGVSRRPFLRRPESSEKPYPDVYRLSIPFDTAAVVTRAMNLVGLAYDNEFLPENGKMYCSELIAECYRDSDGKPLFEAHPMNWRDKEGNLPAYWVEHFKMLGTGIPEGVPGTNPTDMARSPLLKKL